jgi:hypothetical protein
VIAHDLIRVIFENWIPFGLGLCGEDGGSARDDMTEILISLAILKLKSRL